jgi:hypothetical protein
MKPPVDPSVADFVKALARANAARDIARLHGREGSKDATDERRRAGFSR